MDKNAVCGEFPEFCYKAFDCEGRAQQFIWSGILRLACLRYYRNIEDPSRRDAAEGSGCTREPGIVTEGLVSRNPTEKTIWTRKPGYLTRHQEFADGVFCFCTSSPDVDLKHMRNRYGKHIVKIDDPRRLAEDINEHLISSGQKFVIRGCKVVYNKGQKLDRKVTDSERIDLSYAQKPPDFADDHEFRIVAITREPLCKEECRYLSGQFEQIEPTCKFIEVDLKKPLNYTQLSGE